jgi:hypothetical protein
MPRKISISKQQAFYNRYQYTFYKANTRGFTISARDIRRLGIAAEEAFQELKEMINANEKCGLTEAVNDHQQKNTEENKIQ